MPKHFPLQPKGFSPFLELVGVTFTTIENGYSRSVVEVSERLLNSSGIMHGGATFTLADCGMGAALYSCLDEDEQCRTIETKIVYFRAVGSGALTCDSKVIHRSKRIATLESEIKQRGHLIAKALGTFSVYKGKKE
jgi:acyl-CoA thioesterase